MSMTILLALAAATPEVPPLSVQVVQEGRVFVMRNLIDSNPLYTFDGDEPGKSNCNAACATAWPPFKAPADAKPIGEWTLVKRDDGSIQWAYEDMPVYSFSRDPEAVATPRGATGWHLLPTFPAP